MRTFKDIETDGYIAVRNAVLEAYNLGLAEGRREGEELRAKLVAILGTPNVVSAVGTGGAVSTGGAISTAAVTDSAVVTDSFEAEIVRATPGTVKPRILHELRKGGDGFTTEEIIAATGFKPGSVRGTLSTLASEELVGRFHGHWFALGTFTRDDGKTVTHTSDDIQSMIDRTLAAANNPSHTLGLKGKLKWLRDDAEDDEAPSDDAE
jgi:hypothetical protein